MDSISEMAYASIMDVRERINVLRNNPKVKGKHLHQIFGKNLTNIFSYENVSVGRCLHCFRYMSHEEMNPLGSHSQASCPECFTKWKNQVLEICFMCQQPLPEPNIISQGHLPNVIQYKFCDDECRDYFSIISCIILGEDMSFLRDSIREDCQPQEYQPFSYIERFQIQISNDDLRYRSGEMGVEESQIHLKRLSIVNNIILLHRKINETHDINQRNILEEQQMDFRFDFNFTDIDLDKLKGMSGGQSGQLSYSGTAQPNQQSYQPNQPYQPGPFKPKER